VEFHGKVRSALLGALIVAGGAACAQVIDLRDDYRLRGDGGVGPGGLDPDGGVLGGGGEGGIADDGGTCVANLEEDSRNCGRCGRDCGGAACNAGTCAPVLLATVQSPSVPFAVDQGAVYFADGDSIAAVDKNSGARRTFAPTGSGVSDPTALGAAQGLVFWGNTNFSGGGATGLRVCGVPGCDGGARNIAPNLYAAYGIAELRVPASPWPVVWLQITAAYDWNVEYGVSDGGVGRLATAFAKNETTCMHLAASASTAYVAHRESDSIFAIPLNGTPRVALSIQHPCGLAVRGDRVFFSDESNIWSSAITGVNTLAPPVQLANGQKEGNGGVPAYVAVDADDVYWIASLPAPTLLRCKQSGCNLMPGRLGALPGGGGPSGLLVDERWIYFVVRSVASPLESTVWKVAK
jgi:hypothetical protein